MKEPQHPKLNLHIYQTPFKFESRMLKETKSLADAGFFDQIDIAAIWQPGLAEHEAVDEKRKVWRIKVHIPPSDHLLPRALHLLEWQWHIFSAYRHGVSVVNCHSLAVLPLGWLLKKVTGAKLVYDTHELQTETTFMTGLRRPLAKMLERLLIHTCDLVMTVNDSIRDWYRTAYDLHNVYTARNIPYRQDAPKIQSTPNIKNLREVLGLPEDAFLFLHLGYLLPARGIELMLEAFAHADPHRHLLFIGEGELGPLVQSYAQKHANIHVLPLVKPTEVQHYSAQADVGLVLTIPNSLNYYFILPNKLYEYVLTGVPVIASDLPEIRRVVDEGHCGWLVAADCNDMVALINSLTREDIRAKHEGALAYSQKVGWQDEERTMLLGYRECGVVPIT